MKISSLLTNAGIATGVAAAAIISAPLASSAATFGFLNISGGDTVGDSLAQYLSFDVNKGDIDGKSTQFTFKFAVAAPTGFITKVYIDSAVGDLTSGPKTALLGTNIIIQDSPPAVDFTGGVGDDNLPQGNEPSLGARFTTDYAFKSVQGIGNSKAINPGESLSVLFSDAQFSDVVAAVLNRSLRVGYHVQGINGKSDSYVSVPVPGFFLGIIAAGALGGTRLLKNKKQTV